MLLMCKQEIYAPDQMLLQNWGYRYCHTVQQTALQDMGCGRLGSKETCIAEGLHHGALLIGQRVWHLEAEVGWVVNIPRQGAMHRRCSKELHIWVQIVPSLPVYQPCMVVNSVPINMHFCISCF